MFALKDEQISSSKRRVKDEELIKDANKKSKVDATNISDGHQQKEVAQLEQAESALSEKMKGSDSTAEGRKYDRRLSIGFGDTTTGMTLLQKMHLHYHSKKMNPKYRGSFLSL